MRKRLPFSIAFIGLILGGCATNSPTVSSKNIKIEHLHGAQYLNGLIWQDKKINTTTKFSQEDAVHYCENLNLLGMKGWRLPSVSEATNSLHAFKTLKYTKSNRYYHSSSRRCTTEEYMNDTVNAPLILVGNILGALVGGDDDTTSPECQYGHTSTRVLTESRTGSALVRCVLDPDKYKKSRSVQLGQMEGYRKQNNYAGYMKAFKISNEIQDIKKAYALADTIEKKLQAEKYLVDNMPAEKLVDVSIYNKNKSTVKVTQGDVLKVFSYAGSHKSISVQTKVSSDYLEYGKYKVDIQYTLDIPYEMTATLLLTITSQEHLKRTVTKSYILDKANHYTQSATVTFSDVMSNMHMSMGSIKIKGDAQMSANILSIEEAR